MNQDTLVKCPKCKEEHACYKVPVNETKFGYWCMGCGFHSTDLMIKGEFEIEPYEETLPELYKELRHIDEDGRIWYPTAVNEVGGTVFANGTSKDNWQWSAIQTVPLTEEEMKMPKHNGINYKSDPKTLAHFGTDFIEACDYVGLFNKK